MAAYKYLSPDGVIVPDTSAILTEAETEFKDVMGQDVPTDEETPQGVLIASDVAVRSEVVANNAALANQINPEYAGGIFLDDLWAFTGGKRRDSTYTLVDNVKLTGVPGVRIPSGVRRQSTLGDMFQLLNAVTLDANGVGYGQFQAIVSGPVPCPVGALTKPVSGYTSVGWETSYNEEAGSIGTTRQSDLSAKQERKQTLALNGRSLSEAVYSRVRAVDGVRSISYRENNKNVADVIDGINLVANSVWVAVDGGTDADIVAALYRAKTGGANWNGAVAVDYRDPFSNQKTTVKFDRPVAKPIVVRVTADVVGTSTGDPDALIKQALVDYANGLLENGEPGFVLGEDVSPYELASAVNYRAAGTIFVRKIEIGLQPTTGSPVYSTETMAIGLKEKATLDLDSVTVV